MERIRPYYFPLVIAAMLLLGIGDIYFAKLPQNMPLYGSSFLSSAGVLLVDAACIITALAWLRRHDVDVISCAIFLLWAVVSLHYLHISINETYTNDVTGHIGKAQFIAYHWLQPYGYRGWEEHQPPLYYYFAGAAVRLADTMAISQLLALRFLSWMFFAVFNVYSLLALRRCGFSGSLYYIAALLLLCWPDSLHIASKINSEILYDAVYAAAFYHVLCWYHERLDADLAKAIGLAALSFAVKTSGIIILTILGVLVLIAMLRRWPWRAFIRQYGVALGAVGALCLFLNIGNMVFTGYTFGNHLGGIFARDYVFPMQHYFILQYTTLLTQPYNDWTMTQGFWDYLLKTAIYGEYAWRLPRLAATLNFTLAAMAFYALAAWLIARREDWRGMLPHALNIVVPLLFLVWFFIRTNMYATQDIRYIYPSILSFVVFYGKSCTLYRQRGTIALAVLGPLLAVCFTTLSIIHFWIDFR